uniref:snurportin-1 n=1 Tax=Erigeron canadensis TaxID=72917 RepID=UPI001CB8A32D|nr:snurportin-1 [Erigeron canadensis]
MAPHEIRRPFKRAAISDQQKRRELSLQRQAENRTHAQLQARRLASSILSFPNHQSEPESVPEPESHPEPIVEEPESDVRDVTDMDIRQAAKLKGYEARRWYASQLMLPEWMIDVPDRLNHDWYVFARPSGKRCFVVSSNGTTVSRLRNGSQLHRFPSSLPNGAKTKEGSRSAHSYCILDCIFHELDQTYYVIDMVCWAGISFYECTAEFRFFWMNSKLIESGACEEPSTYHRYRFSLLSVDNCDQEGLQTAYTGSVPYVKDGLLFYNKHAHYQTGNTPLALVWKDQMCSQYVIDTDNKGQVPNQQQVVLELQDNGQLVTSDDPPVVLGCLNATFIQETGLNSGNLLRFAVNEGGLTFVDGKLEKANLQYVGKVHRARAFADSYSKIVFQYMVRHSPLQIEHLFASMGTSNEQDSSTDELEMDGLMI